MFSYYFAKNLTPFSDADRQIFVRSCRIICLLNASKLRSLVIGHSVYVPGSPRQHTLPYQFQRIASFYALVYKNDFQKKRFLKSYACIHIIHNSAEEKVADAIFHYIKNTSYEGLLLITIRRQYPAHYSDSTLFPILYLLSGRETYSKSFYPK